MGEARIGRCADYPNIRRVDSVVRQMGVETTDKGIEALVNGSTERANELIGLGRRFIDLAARLDELLTSTCAGPGGGACTADRSVIGTIDQICDDIIYEKPELERRSAINGDYSQSGSEATESVYKVEVSEDDEASAGCICDDGAYCAGYEQWLASGCEGIPEHWD